MTVVEEHGNEGRAAEWRARNRIRTHMGRAATGLAVGMLTFAIVAISVQHIGGYLVSQRWKALPVTLVGALCLALAAYVVWIGGRAVATARAAGRAAEPTTARAFGALASDLGFRAMSYAGALLILTAGAWFLTVNDAAVSRTFFDLSLIAASAGKILAAFWTNIVIFSVSWVLILIWSLAVAIARTLPGEAGKPIRTLAIIYGDLFRGLPAIITIYLIGFGLPLTNLPVLSNLSSTSYAIIALTLTYGAYTSEVYRAGIESVHQSQIAAARSLGLSHARTMRYVVIPQALRGIVPPLMNNCISLQKDTALVAIIGTIDAFNQSKIIAANNFNLSAVTTVAILFILITIPQARLVDKLTERDRRRIRSGG